MKSGFAPFNLMILVMNNLYLDVHPIMMYMDIIGQFVQDE